MNYKIINGAVSYGAETILEEINFEIKEKERIAIVGRNGCGKSTLLKALIHPEILETGVGEKKFQVMKQGNFTIGHLSQIAFSKDENTFLEEILTIYPELTALERKMNELEELLSKETKERWIAEYSKARERYEQLDGYSYQKEYQTIVHQFGFTKEDLEKKLNQFSGGQKTKIAFIKLLLLKPDILLLDEPTNHLDIEAIEWLEGYLKNYPKAVVIVSHDRMFLNQIVNKVYEIEYAAITEYTGNYASFERQKKENYEKQKKDFEYQQKEIKRLTAIADRFRYKPTKAKMALSKLKQIEHMVKIEEPNGYDLKTFRTNFNPNYESGKLVLSVRRLSIGYEKKIVEISFDLVKGQKLAIIGANGMGKSTLLKTLVGKIPKISGEFEYGYHVEKEYFDQQLIFPDLSQTVYQEFSRQFPNLTITQTRSALASFLFFKEDMEKEIKSLSGGERVRLALCKILKKGPNLLLLDEPTNHLDILGKESLEELLQQYTGTLLFVSHDRYFVNKIADSLLIFENGNVKYFQGNYEEYLEKKQKQNIIEVKKETERTEGKNQNYLISKEKNKAKTRMITLEREIEKKEEKIQEYENEMLKEEVYTDYVKANAIQKEIQILKQEVEEKTKEWEELYAKI